MRILTITIGGELTPGDVVCLQSESAGGGRTQVGHIVGKTDTFEGVASSLANSVGTHFCQPLFQTKVSGEKIILVIHADDIEIGWYVEHIVGSDPTQRAPGGSETVTISEE